MAQPQAITYQYDLFSEQRQDVIRPFPTSETVCGASGTKAFQVKEAGEQERALTPDLMSLVLSHDNIKAAYKQVKRNKGVAGIDQMPTGDFAEWYSQNAETLQSELYNGAYQPQGVKQVEIPKPNGGKRKLGIPTVTDRIIQQAISQVLNPIYERKFSDHSYGFRPNRNAHQALKKGSEYVSEGRVIVVDMDLKTFFDVVNHDRLMYLLSTTISDKTLLWLIRKYLQSGILIDGVVSQRTEGMPQGSPLSPLLSNIVLDELDKELERRGHKFVRYADIMKLGIILETKELEKAWNAFRFAVTAKNKGHEVKVFLMGEAVECEGLIDVKYNVDEQLNKFIEVGGEILACGTCLKSRQLESTEACPISTMIDCVEVVEWADKMVTF